MWLPRPTLGRGASTVPAQPLSAFLARLAPVWDDLVGSVVEPFVRTLATTIRHLSTSVASLGMDAIHIQLTPAQPHCQLPSPTRPSDHFAVLPYLTSLARGLALERVSIGGVDLAHAPDQLMPVLQAIVDMRRFWPWAKDAGAALLESVFPLYATPRSNAACTRLMGTLMESLTKANPAGCSLTALAATCGSPSLGFAHKTTPPIVAQMLSDGLPSLKGRWLVWEALGVWALLYSAYQRGDEPPLGGNEPIAPATSKRGTQRDAGYRPPLLLPGAVASWARDALTQWLNIGHASDSSAQEASPLFVTNYVPSPLYTFLQERCPPLLAALGPSRIALSTTAQSDWLPKLAGLAVHWGHSSSVNNGQWYAYVQLRGCAHRRWLKALNRLFPTTSEADSRHMTLHMADAVWSAVGAMKKSQAHKGLGLNAKSRLSRAVKSVNYVLQHIPVGTPQPLAISVLYSALFHKEKDIVRATLLLSGMLVGPANDVASRLKALSQLVRKAAFSPYGDALTDRQVAALAYYELAFGRSAHVTDWDQERKNRCGPTFHIHMPRAGPNRAFRPSTWVPESSAMSQDYTWRDPDFYLALRAEVRAIADILVTKRNTKETLPRFFKRRHEWMASGSSAGFTLPAGCLKVRPTAAGDHARIPSEVQQRSAKAQKRAWAEAVTYQDVENFLRSRAPHELAHASEKMENGKARAIYGVEPMHYLINTYATKGFEERLHLVPGLEKGLAGVALACTEMQRANITADKDIECTMLDYADFNRHHTPEAQALIFEEFAAAGRRVGSSRDWILANEWVAKAKWRMSVLFPGSRQAEKVNQGMFSGTRSTDLINTILNLAYFQVAAKWVAANHTVKPVELYTVHQGDDVWISNCNPLWARLIFYTLNHMGFIFQESKQMFGPGRGEYLRVLYSGGKGYGYFARAMANYVLRPVQQENPLDPCSWARTVNEGAQLLARRGLELDGCTALYENGMGFWARLRSHGKDHAPLSLPKAYLSASAAEGGLSCPPPGCMWQGGAVPSALHLPPLESTITMKGLTLPNHMTEDWLEHVSSLRTADPNLRQFNADAVRDTIHHLNFTDVLTATQRERGWAKLKVQYAEAIASLRSKHPMLHEAQDQLMPVYSDDTNVRDVFYRSVRANRDLRSGMDMYIKFNSIAVDTLWQASPRKGVPMSLTAVSDALQATVIRSRFKNETLTARAYGVTRHTAMAIIVSEAAAMGQVSEDVKFIVAAANMLGGDAIIDALLLGCGSLLPTMLSHANAGLWQYAEQAAVETIIRSLADRDLASVSQLLASQPTFAVSLLRDYAMAPGAQSPAVVY